MNIITDKLPNEIKGHPIYTDYRRWVTFETLIQDEELTSQEKEQEIISLIFKSPYDFNFSDLVGGIFNFYQCQIDNKPQGKKQVGTGEPKKAKIYDLRIDDKLILSAFWQAYGIDLANPDTELHWFKFLALLSGLPANTRLSEIMRIRGTDTTKLKGEEKKHMKQLQNLYALEDTQVNTLSDEDIKNELNKRYKEMQDTAITAP